MTLERSIMMDIIELLNQVVHLQADYINDMQESYSFSEEEYYNQGAIDALDFVIEILERLL